MSEILISPLISEKMNNLNQKLNKVGFHVSKESNKIQIKNEVEKMYGVTVKSVATSVVPGKAKSRYTKKRNESWHEIIIQKSLRDIGKRRHD